MARVGPIAKDVAKEMVEAMMDVLARMRTVIEADLFAETPV